jgi:predicted nucleotidyltransferase
MNDSNKISKLSITDSVGARLGELQASLEAALGDALSALIVHGSAVRGGWKDGTSDVDLIVVLANDERETLDRASNALMIARYAARIEAMILTAGEIPRAADVFPVFYDDIRRQHVVLAGKDPFAELVIADHHLRLRVEQELREAQIRLRRVVVDASGNKAVLTGQIVRKVRQIRAPLRSLLGLKGVACGDDLEAVLGAAAQAYGVKEGLLFDAALDPLAAHAALAALLGAAIQDADRMEKSP